MATLVESAKQRSIGAWMRMLSVRENMRYWLRCGGHYRCEVKLC
jgi:hypothetical protein